MYINYKPILEVVNHPNQSLFRKEMSNLKRSIPDHVIELVNDGMTHFKRQNISGIVEVDRRANQLNNCYRLMICLDAPYD